MAKPVNGITVLVVDGNRAMRELIGAIISAEPGISVVGEASSGAEAVAMVPLLKPDMVTIDIENPGGGGLDAIGEIIAQHPVPILAVTPLATVRTAFEAVSKGALDVVETPDSPEKALHLVTKIRRLSKVDMAMHLSVMGRRVAPAGHGPMKRSGDSRNWSIVAIAASTGGPHAIHTILAQLPATFPVPIVIAQHIAEGFARGMVDWLNSGTALTVVEPRTGESLAPGRVYVNPAEYSMTITKGGVIRLSDRSALQIYRPSCDMLLTSVAKAFGESSIGVILTGMGDDGVAGMEAIKAAGGLTLAQDAKTSVVFGMNQCAIQRSCIDKVLPLGELASHLMRCIRDER